MSEIEKKSWWIAKAEPETLGVTGDLSTAQKAVEAVYLEENPGTDPELIWFDLRDGDYVLTVGRIPDRDYSAYRTELL